MHNPQLIKSFTAAGAIASHRIVQMNSSGNAVQASSTAGALMGTTELAASSGDRVDVIVDGIVEVQAGIGINVGDWLTADSNGKAVTATYTNSYVGMTLASTNDMPTFGLTAEFGNRVSGVLPDPRSGLRSANIVRVGESFKELIICSDLGYFIKKAID